MKLNPLLMGQQALAQDATRFRVKMDRGQTLPYRLK